MKNSPLFSSLIVCVYVCDQGTACTPGSNRGQAQLLQRNPHISQTSFHLQAESVSQSMVETLPRSHKQIVNLLSSSPSTHSFLLYSPSSSSSSTYTRGGRGSKGSPREWEEGSGKFFGCGMAVRRCCCCCSCSLLH